MKRVILLAATALASFGLALPATAGASTARVPGAVAALSAHHHGVRVPVFSGSGPVPLVDLFPLTIAADSSLGIETHGAGSQVTVETTHTEFYSTVTTGGNIKFHVNGSSHCLEGNPSSTAVVASDCAAGDGYQEWVEVPRNNGCSYQNLQFGGSGMGVLVNEAGRPVWMLSAQGYTTWGECA